MNEHSKDLKNEEVPEWAKLISNQLAQLIKLSDAQLGLQRFADLGEDRIATINHFGRLFRLYLPFGDIDHIQRNILRTRGFYEWRMLSNLASWDIVRPNGIIIDAGANIGNHTVFFGTFFKPKKMHCFEPQDACFDALQRNVALNLSDQDIHLHKCILGSVTGNGKVIAYKSGNFGAARFGADEKGDLEMTTIDNSLSESEMDQVSLIKIDVEGNELEVLGGSMEVLKIGRAVLWVETFAEQKAETDAMLAEYGYFVTKLGNNNYIYSKTRKPVNSLVSN